jgi:CBS domain-containing protein
MHDDKDLEKQGHDSTDSHDEHEGATDSATGMARSRKPHGIDLNRRLELTAHPPSTLRGVFENCLVSEIALSNWSKKRPVLISDNQTLERALSRINAHEVHSLPVVSKGDVIGIIDILDITLGIAQSANNKPIRAKKSEFLTRPVSLLFAEKESKTYVIPNQKSLWEATAKLIEFGQERFLIVDRAEGEVEVQSRTEPFVDGVLTASDVIRFLAQNISYMREESLFSRTVSELGLGTKAPKIVSMVDNAGVVFTEMGRTKCGGVAVVDNLGRLRASLSSSDLKGLSRKTLNVLNNTVENYLLRDRKRGWWVKPIVVTKDELLITVILEFVCSRCHRMYLVDQDFRPVGEISHTDVLKLLLTLKTEAQS